MLHALTSPERVKRSLSGGDLDRIPCYFRAHRQLWDRQRAELNVRDDYSVARHFGSDAFHHTLSLREDAVRKSPSADTYYDMFGNRFRVTRSGWDSDARVDVPVLAPDGELLALDAIRWPDASVLDMDRCVQGAAAARESGFAIYGGVWASIFTRARELVGEETLLVSMYEEPAYVEGLVARITDFFLEINGAYLDRCREYLDVYYFGTDFGTQRALFISPEHFRAFFKPQLKRVADQAKQYGLPVMFHTCGCVAEIIDDLIDCGIDILDPVQVSAHHMAPDDLVRFKGRIAFNGGVSTQTTLPFGTPEDVRAETFHLIRTLGPDRLIVAPDQDMIGDLSTANITALFDAVRAYKV